MKTKLLFLLPMLAVLFAACEKDSQNEPQMNLTPSKDVQAVDLGLSVKWANMNIGATKPEGYGAYFAWGETKPKEVYDWSTYKYCAGRDSTLTKYCATSEYGYNGFTDSKTILDPEDDAAHVNWGGNWRIPTNEEIYELRKNCTWTWTTLNGINGYKVKGKNGNSIFLPASGCHWSSSTDDVGSEGYYWSTLFYDSRSHSAYYLDLRRENFLVIGRVNGLSVRPVCQ